MPRVSVWFIRASLLHLLSGAALGAAYLAWKAYEWFPFAVSLRQVHVEQMLVGWLVQLVVGVAFWILPRPEGRDPGAYSGQMWVIFGLLNAGVLAAALGSSAALPDALGLAGRAAEAAAAALFLIHAWHRQRPYRTATRQLLV